MTSDLPMRAPVRQRPRPLPRCPRRSPDLPTIASPRASASIHAWAASLPALGPTEDSQRDWSAEYFARWAATPQAGSLGRMPLIVLTRARGGFRDSLDKPAAELERIRLEAQRGLATLSTAGEQRIVESGHSMHLEAPEVVARAIGDIVEAVRRR